MSTQSPISSASAAPSNPLPGNTFERIKNSLFSSALTHILNPLAGLLRFLIAGTPKSLTIGLNPSNPDTTPQDDSLHPPASSVPRVPARLPDNPPDEFDDTESEYWSACGSPRSEGELDPNLWDDSVSTIESGSTTASESSSDSVSTADAINYKVIHYHAALKVIDDLLAKSSGSQKASLEQLSELITRSAGSLREKQSTSLSFDRDSIKQNIGGKRKRSKMMDVFCSFKREQTALIQAGKSGTDIPEHTRHVHIRTALASVIHGKFRGLGLRARSHSIEEIDKQIFDSYIDVLQTKDWDNIFKSNALNFADKEGNRKTLRFNTTMTAAKNMDAVLANNYQQDNVQGICSYAIREQRHAVNLWKTEFRPAQPGEFGTKHEFSGLRHGVHDAYGIKDPAERAAANDARVKEFIHASVLEHISRNNLEPALLNPEEALSIDIVSVNLLTPASKEKDMILQQQSAFSRANNKEIQIQIADEKGNEHTIKVKPRILMFSTPVNHLSLSKTGSMIGIWRTADSINKNAIRTLVGSGENSKAIGGMAAARIQGLKAELSRIPANSPENSNKRMELTEKILLIQQLTTQVRDIYSNKTHHRVGNEPYKLPTRLLALANEIGATPAFNCKSGKDRTGQLNVEIRDLYAHLNAENGQLRDVNTMREGLAQENYQQLFFAGGDREVQALNTGAPGSKSQLPYYNKLMGVTPNTIDEIKGLSKWVGT